LTKTACVPTPAVGVGVYSDYIEIQGTISGDSNDLSSVVILESATNYVNNTYYTYSL